MFPKTALERSGNSAIADPGSMLPCGSRHFLRTPVIVRRVMVHFGLRHSLRPRDPAKPGVHRIFLPGPNHGRHVRRGRVILEFPNNVI